MSQLRHCEGTKWLIGFNVESWCCKCWQWNKRSRFLTHLNNMWTLWTVACKIDQCRFSCQHLPAIWVADSFLSLFFQRCNTTASGNLVGQDCVNPKEMAGAQVDADPGKRWMERERQTSPDRQMILGRAGSGRTDGGVASLQAEASEKAAKTKPQPPREQMEGNSGSETTTGGRWGDRGKKALSVFVWKM